MQMTVMMVPQSNWIYGVDHLAKSVAECLAKREYIIYHRGERTDIAAKCKIFVTLTLTLYRHLQKQIYLPNKEY